MPIPKIITKYADKDRVDRAIDTFAAKENPTNIDLHTDKAVAQIETTLNKYRAAAKHMAVSIFCRKNTALDY